MKKVAIYIMAAVAVGVTTAGKSNAQSSSPAPTPTQPVLARATDGSWTIVFKYKDSPPAKPNDAKSATVDLGHQVVSLKVEKTGKTYHAVAIDASQGRTETWYMNGIEVSKPPGAKQFNRVTSSSPFFLDFSKADFDELSWIGMDAYKGIVDGPEGAKQFVFEARNVKRRRTTHEAATDGNLADLAEKIKLVPAGTDGKHAEAKMLELQYGDTVSRAVLDVFTQLPIEYDDGAVHRTYSFSEAPVPIPQDVVQLVKSFNEQARRASVPAPPP